MQPAYTTVPIFPLGEETTWDDIENAMAGSAEYQSSKLGRIIPLMFFAPLTEPPNPDAWEPLRTTPLNLLVISIERQTDATMREALRQAAAVLGAPEPAFGFGLPGMEMEEEGPLAAVYEQMTAADLRFHAFEQTGEDDPSFYFIRGGAAVRAFHRGLRAATGGSVKPPPQ